MKKYNFIFILVLFFNSTWAQNPNLDFKNALKVYNLTTYEEFEKTEKANDSSSTYFLTTTKNLQILHPTIAFQWKTKKNNFHEIELTNFTLGKTEENTEVKDSNSTNSYFAKGGDVTTTSISVRYEYILNFNKSKDRKLVPSLGFSANPYFKQNSFSPVISTSFPSKESYFGAKVFVTPRLTYFLTSRLFMEINVPICFSRAYYLIENEEDPSIPKEERKSSTFDFQLFPKIFSGRIGIGLKL